MTEEQWRTCVYNGVTYDGYEVSNTGKVRSLNYKRTRKTKMLKQAEDKDGYLYVVFWKNGKQKVCKLHRLVACTFIPNPDNLPEVNHINEDKTDNIVENLEWCNRKYNVSYGTRTERTSKRVRCVETGIIYGSIIEVERETGLDRSSICACCKGKRYKTVGGFHWEYYTEDTEKTTEESENLCFKPLTLVA